MKRSLPASLLALAAALALAGCTTYTGTPAAPPASETVPTEPGWEPTPFDCATLATEGDKPEQLPEGAARITLCDEPGHEIRQTTPPDALVSDTAAVVSAYNTQEHANLAVMACTADLGPAYRMVFEYPGGETVSVRGEMYGCRVVGDKTGAQAVLGAFTTALTAQREHVPVTVSDPLANATCATDASWASWLTPAMADTVAGYRCAQAGAQAATEPTRFDEAAWATIRDDWTANAAKGSRTDDEINSCQQVHLDQLVGLNAAGEKVSLNGMCGVFEVWSAGDLESWVWRPGPAASELLGLGG
ncbi:hypothetical protein J4N02_07705 [Propioniciclava sp. MC1595]|uniref:hypothetical protein n=1 Tax=Propioniciclava sp. MC1595 TaxID=2760308 RepID=UPI00166267F3|nr:hypothetical protein [Propioniciclava sp. MC1595]MBB1494555.1 hypothetical protein [Propioniciclava sp. MC1595]QTE27448.1 hypothetical protein J4N02_07705 [Propioniciclava sp. MC1595]